MPVSAAPFTHDDTEDSKKVADFPRRLTPELSSALLRHAQEFLERQGIRDEPIEWHPPTDLLHDLRLPSLGPGAVDITVLHRLIRHDHQSLHAAAERLNSTFDDVRYALELHPAPAPNRRSRPRGRPSRLVYGAAKAALPREKLIQLYHGDRNSLRDIGANIGVSRQTITRLARDYDIPLRQLGRSATYDIDRDWLYEQYVIEHRSLENIAAECGMSVANMARWAKVHDIPVRRLSRYYPQDLQADDRIPPILRPVLVGVGGWERLQRLADAASYRTLQIAAQELGLSQFTLVDQVKRIERDLGDKVLIRAKSGRPMRLTLFGSQVVAAVRAVADVLEPGHNRESIQPTMRETNQARAAPAGG